MPPTSTPDPFPPEGFDAWAGSYDQDVTGGTFPFTGYPAVLDTVVRQAGARPGMSVLDLGAGTGNLTARFLALGCEAWGTDFSQAMLETARAKLPAARFLRHDLRAPFPPELIRRFDRIVSAYVFHHFELPEKAALIERLAREHLAPGGRIVIADLSFETQAAMDAVCASAGEAWEAEPYWVAADALPALRSHGLSAEYTQVSDCAGVYAVALPG